MRYAVLGKLPREQKTGSRWPAHKAHKQRSNQRDVDWRRQMAQ